MHHARRPQAMQKKEKPRRSGAFSLSTWRREPESNRPKRLCRPLHNRFAIAPKADCANAVRQATDFYSRTESPSNKKGSVASPLLGAGNESCTRALSLCFPITFSTVVISEELNYSLVFRPRQQSSSNHFHQRPRMIHPPVVTPDASSC